MPAARLEEIELALNELRSGKPHADVARTIGRSASTVKQWQRKFGDLTPDELRSTLAPVDTRYIRIMDKLFQEKWDGSQAGFVWDRDELSRISNDLNIIPPKNLGDNIYSIRHGRETLPEPILALAPEGKTWLLLPHGKSSYNFVLADRAFLDPDPSKRPIKIPDSTPQIVARYAKRDEQAVLARIRYCRLVDIFLGMASFQLQSHMRTTIARFNGAQTELDEIYVGINGSGAQFVIPVQAKSRGERIGAVQIVTDQFTCQEKFPDMIARTLAAQTIHVEEIEQVGQIFTIAIIEAATDDSYNVTKIREEHFKLVPSAMISLFMRLWKLPFYH